MQSAAPVAAAETRVARVASASEPGRRWRVEFPPGRAPTCDCPSYYFRSGLDGEGRCKHIRAALDRGVVWVSQLGEAETCSCCGAPLAGP